MEGQKTSNKKTEKSYKYPSKTPMTEIAIYLRFFTDVVPVAISIIPNICALDWAGNC